ncbi:hypothetical protein [Rubinisphaera brasiliensis]|uniref:Uncharacterized protein n=1 Tax=Rubinisphaera brasiliensis (strain ATCC 49424 / DSM 5305 / JCM 21570 / IAM 15109 / NBRC 103401 / IFAM 1448) TaxID=756272 RepID=F0SQ66_RUBBR|nr:hypothetical protein [Rubinisphaera brasiliensis]ADY61243.1 hypothetical protein Plabr_3646 [Rubinisphaera brasiliensis DSM 5305]
MSEQQNGEPEYTPSPEEIEEACREIRAEWSYTERRQRLGRPAIKDEDRTSPRAIPAKFSVQSK